MPMVETWDRAVPGFSDDRLMLVETEHRVSNEVSAALAALHLVRSAKGSKARWRLLDEAIGRLEGFGAAHRLLSTKPSRVVDLGQDLETLCTALVRSRSCSDTSMMRLDLPSIEIDGPTARRLLVIAAELVTNALRYALAGRGGELTVSLVAHGADVVLTVIDDGPGFDSQAAAKGTGIGTPLVGELVHRAGGRILRESGPDGTAIQVCLPFDPSRIGRARQDG